jgi:hypothetical protein
MNEHVFEWLEAYHDGELKGRRLQIIEAHLNECASCRAELARLESLSVLLQDKWVLEPSTPPERFVAQVHLRMERKPERTPMERVWNIILQAIPLVLISAWVSMQALFVAKALLYLMFRFRFLSDLGSLLIIFEDRVPGLDLLINILVSLLIGFLYLSWLASWWVRRRRQNGYPMHADVNPVSRGLTNATKN